MTFVIRILTTNNMIIERINEPNGLYHCIAHHDGEVFIGRGISHFEAIEHSLKKIQQYKNTRVEREMDDDSDERPVEFFQEEDYQKTNFI